MKLRTVVIAILSYMVFFYFALEWFGNVFRIILDPIILFGILWITLVVFILSKEISERIKQRCFVNTTETDKSKSDKILKIVGLHVLFIFFGLCCNVLPHLFFPQPARSMCRVTETSAKNTLAALSSYFSVPGRMKLPTVEELIELENLRLDKDIKAIIGGDFENSVVAIATDTTGKCQRGKHFILDMAGGYGYWTDEWPADIPNPYLEKKEPESFFVRLKNVFTYIF